MASTRRKKRSLTGGGRVNSQAGGAAATANATRPAEVPKAPSSTPAADIIAAARALLDRIEWEAERSYQNTLDAIRKAAQLPDSPTFTGKIMAQSFGAWCAAERRKVLARLMQVGPELLGTSDVDRKAQTIVRVTAALWSVSLTREAKKALNLLRNQALLALHTAESEAGTLVPRFDPLLEEKDVDRARYFISHASEVLFAEPGTSALVECLPAVVAIAIALRLVQEGKSQWNERPELTRKVRRYFEAYGWPKGADAGAEVARRILRCDPDGKALIASIERQDRRKRSAR